MRLYFILVIISAFLLTVFFGALAFYFWLKKIKPDIAHHADLIERGESWLISRWWITFWLWVISPVEQWLIRHHISPNTITLISLSLYFLSGFFFALGNFGIGGWLVIIGGTFDIFDGRIARQLNSVSKAGAFLDSLADRYAEIFSFFGLIVYYNGTGWVYIMVAALLGSLLVSYSRARGEALGISEKRGVMKRAERVIFLGLGTAVSPMVALLLEPRADQPLFHFALCALILMTVLTHYTAIARSIHIFNTLQANPAPESTPQTKEDEPIGPQT